MKKPTRLEKISKRYDRFSNIANINLIHKMLPISLMIIGFETKYWTSYFLIAFILFIIGSYFEENKK